MSKLDVLHLLRSFPGMTVTQMSEFLRMTQPNMTYVVNGLERDGFVLRAASPSNRRTTIVRLTKAGEALVSDITPRHIRAVTKAVARLSAADRNQLMRLLAILADDFEAVKFEENSSIA